MHSVIIHWFSLCIVIYIAVSAKPIFSISISCTTCEVQFSQVCMSYHVKLEIGVYSISDNGKSRNHLKGFKTFETCFFQSVYNGPPRASTNFLWSDQAGVRVILRNMIWVFCCRLLEMCQQLLRLLLKKDSSFDIAQNIMQGYRLQVGST